MEKPKEGGFTGLIAFHLRLILALITFIGFIYGIYFAILTSNKNWKIVAGKTLITLSSLFTCFTLSSFILIVFSILPFLSKLFIICHWLFISFSLIAIILSFPLMSYTAEYRTYNYEDEFKHYCSNTNSSFCDEFHTLWSIKHFIHQRTTAPYVAFSQIIAFWIIFLIPYFIVELYFIRSKLESSKSPQLLDIAPLNSP